MWNIIKALNYQTRRDNVTIYAALIGIAMTAIMFFDLDKTEICGADIAMIIGQSIPMGSILMLAVLTSRICAWDQSDKTINYEVLSGHDRKNVYFSRVVVSLMWCIPLTLIMTALPIIIASLAFGWGQIMDLRGFLIRYALIFLPIIRMLSAYIFLSFFTGSFIASLLTTYLITQGELMIYMFIEEFRGTQLECELGMSNISSLMEFNSRMGFIDGKDISVYDTSLPPEMITKTIIVSLAASAVYLIGGYILFKKRDMK